MIETRLIRELNIRLPIDDAATITTQLSAASALVRVRDHLYVIADDQTYLARFSINDSAPGDIITLFDEQWPEARKARKAAKADLESLTFFPPSRHFPYGALLALGSGSRSNRERGVLLQARADGGWEPPEVINIGPLLAPLKAKFSELNIEAAFVSEDQFVLLQRGNKGDTRNACIRFNLQDVLDALVGKRPFAGIAFILHFYALGDVAGVALSFTDAAALPGGRFAFSAVAENVADNYNDGPCLGAAIGIADLSGKLIMIEALDQPHKVEGIEVQLSAGQLDLLMVTDADAPEVPARLLQARTRP